MLTGGRGTMVDIAGLLEADAPAQASDDVRFSYSRPEHGAFKRYMIQTVEALTGAPALERLYRDWARNPRPGEDVFAAAMRLLNLRLEFAENALAHVPRTGPVLFIANHPFGIADGLALGYLATRIRPDVKIMTHSLLCQPPEARDYLLPVDFGGTEEARQVSLLTRRRTQDWLKAGHAVAIFPAGGVSTAQRPVSGPALDGVWHPFTAKLARIPGVRTIPVHFSGQNSRLFQILSHVHYALRIAVIFHETRRLMGRSIPVTVGEAIDASALAEHGDRTAVLRHLREQTLRLAGPDGPDPHVEFRWPAHINAD